jgi:autotransporter-associated beta strand protein
MLSNWSRRMFRGKSLSKRGQRKKGRCRPRLEQLEERALPSITLPNIPTWVDQGPGPSDADVFNAISGGPVSAAIEAVAVNPNQPGTVFVGTVNGGIWRTTNATPGTTPTWTPLTDQFPSLSIGAIAFAPNNVNVLYAGAGKTSSDSGVGGPEIGLLKTTDGGNTWSLVNDLGVNNRVRNLAVVSTGDVVFAATDAGLMRSQNGGVDFKTLSGSAGTGLPSGGVTDVVLDPVNVNRLYAAVPGIGVFRSTTQGDTWTRIDTNGITGVADSTVIDLAISNALDSSGFPPVYAALIRGGALSGIFRTANTGTSWTAMDLPRTQEIDGSIDGLHPGHQGDNNFSMAADPSRPFIVFVGGDRQDTGLGRVFRGNAAAAAGSTSVQLTGEVGLQWQQVVNLNASLTAPHPDSRDMAFDGFGNLLETDDGGIVRLVNPNNVSGSGNRRWESINGNLELTEFITVAYNSADNRILGGSQDNGTTDQTATITSARNARLAWQNLFFGDSGVVQVDPTNTLLGASDALRYFSTDHLGQSDVDILKETGAPGFFRQGVLEPVPTPIALRINGSGAIFGIGGRTLTGSGIGPDGVFDNTIQFFNPYAINAVEPQRMLIGTDFLYESNNRGDDLIPLGGLNTSKVDDGIDDDGDGVGGIIGIPPFAIRTSDPDEVTPAGRVGTVTAIVYGGRLNGTNQPQLAYVGTRGNGPSGAFLFSRTTDIGTPFVAVTAYPGGRVRDIAVDPENWRSAFILDTSNRVWHTTNGGGNWAELTGDLLDPTLLNFPDLPGRDHIRTDADTALGTIAVVGTGAAAVPVVGGLGGVYRLDLTDPANPHWRELGLGLPNVIVSDLEYNLADDVLVAGTLGRGAWTISNASTVVANQAVLHIDGGILPDAISLVRNAGNPLVLDVSLRNTFGTQTFSVPLSVLDKIEISGGDEVNAFGGNLPGDTLTIDSTNGPIVVPGGISYDGGRGNDSLALVGFASADRYQVQYAANFFLLDESPGTSISNLTFPGTPTFPDPLQQVVTLQRVQGVRDLVASADANPLKLTVVGSDEDDIFTLDNGASPTDGLLRVGVVSTPSPSGSLFIPPTSYAPIDFANKAELTLEDDIFSGADDETFNLSFTEVATGLTAVNVSGIFGNDTMNVASISVPTVVNGGPGNDIIRVGSLSASTPGSVAAISRSLTINGSTNTTTGEDQLIIDDTSDTTPDTFTLTGTSISGLDNPGTIFYSGIERLTVSLGAGGTTGAFTMLGGRITTGTGPLNLTGNVTATSISDDNVATIEGSLSLGVFTRTFTVNDGPAATDLNLAALVSGASGAALIKAGAGRMRLTVDNTYTGTTAINAGILQVDGEQPQSPVVVNSTGTLAGGGRVGAMTVNAGGTVRPGAGQSLTVAGNATFANVNATYVADLIATSVGQVGATGTLALNNATLNLFDINIPNQPQLLPPLGALLPILSAAAITGTFNGLPNNAIAVSSSGLAYRVIYTPNIVFVMRISGPAFQNRAVTPQIDEGGEATLTGHITTILPTDTFFLEVNWGDGGRTETFKFKPSDSRDVVLRHSYLNDGVYSVGLLWRDQRGAFNTDTLTVRVNNVAPVVDAGGDEFFQGGKLTRLVTFADPGQDHWTVTVDFGDGSGPEVIDLHGNRRFLLQHRYDRPGTFRVTVVVNDGDGGIGSASFLARV